MINPSFKEILLLLLLIGILCTLVVDNVFAFLKLPFRVRKNYQRKLISLWCGISIAILCNFRMFRVDIGDETPRNPVWYITPDGAVLQKNNESSDQMLRQYENKPVILITVTDYSVIQNAVLTKLGQALFPVRNIVRWIIVSLPLNSSFESDQVVNEHTNLTFGEAISKHEGLVHLHLRSLSQLVSRFGIPYTLLSSDHMVNTSWAGFSWPSSNRKVINGYQAGILYAVKNIPRGVIMLGDEYYTYNSALFRELQETKVATCWPTGLGRYDDSIVTMPLTKKNVHSGEDQIVGYYNGKSVRLGSVLIEVGGFAVDLEYLRNNVPYKDYWKLAFNGAFTNDELQIALGSIQIMGKQGSEIYVWKTETVGISWPNSISMSDAMLKTNLNTLAKHAFGPRLYLMKKFIKIENHTFYDEYTMERDVNIYFGNNTEEIDTDHIYNSLDYNISGGL